MGGSSALQSTSTGRSEKKSRAASKCSGVRTEYPPASRRVERSALRANPANCRGYINPLPAKRSRGPFSATSAPFPPSPGSADSARKEKVRRDWAPPCRPKPDRVLRKGYSMFYRPSALNPKRGSRIRLRRIRAAQSLEADLSPTPFPNGPGGKSRHHGAVGPILGHAGTGRHGHVVSQKQMAIHLGRPAHAQAMARHRGAGDSGLRGQQAIVPETHVMGDLHMAVQFAPASQYGRIEDAGRHYRIGADPAVLADFHPGGVGHHHQAARLATCGSREKPESVAADHCAGLDYASAPYPAMALDYGIRTYARPGPDIGALVHIGTGFHHDLAFQTAMHRGSRSDAVARAGSMRRRIMETIGKGGEQGGHGRMHGGDPQDRDIRAVQAVEKAVGLQGAGFGFGNDQGGAQGPAYPQRGFRPQ